MMKVCLNNEMGIKVPVNGYGGKVLQSIKNKVQAQINGITETKAPMQLFPKDIRSVSFYLN